MKKILFLVVSLFIFSGCATKSNVCPSYPKPSQHTLSKIQSLNDSETNVWMIKQYKLNKQLKICNE